MSSSIKSIMNERIIPFSIKFMNAKAIIALKDGILFTLPLIMIGSIFLLLANIPYEPLANFISDHGWNEPLLQAYGSTFSIIALIAAVGIAYTYVKNEGYEPLSAGFISLAVFLLLTNQYVINDDGVKFDNVIPKEWTAGQGMISAIIIGLIVGAVYTWFMKKDIRIKMPAGVPDGVANSFSALIPGAVLIVGATAVYTFFRYVLDTTLVEFIYKILQTPLQGMTDSVGGVIVYCLIATVFWWFGVHGGTIVTGLMLPILLSNIASNQEMIDSGKALTVENGAHIVTDQFTAVFINMTGTGVTIGLVLYMFLFAKSEQFKKLGKFSIVPAIFNINEPVIFGSPIVMNPFLLIPFIATPTIVGLLMYAAIALGLIPPFSGVVVPWTTPPIISGFLLGGWRTALAQVVILFLSFFIYLPFVSKLDKINLEKEKNEQQQQ